MSKLIIRITVLLLFAYLFVGRVLACEVDQVCWSDTAQTYYRQGGHSENDYGWNDSVSQYWSPNGGWRNVGPGRAAGDEGGGGGGGGGGWRCPYAGPAKVTLIGPANKQILSEGVMSATGSSRVTLGWSPITTWGEDCSGNTVKEYKVYAKAGSKTFDAVKDLQGTLTSTASSGMIYSFRLGGLKQNSTYYWKVVSTNKVMPTNSDIRTMTTPAKVTGTLFDMTDGGTCATLATSLKMPGTVTFNATVSGMTKSYEGVAGANGLYSVVALTPGNYKVNFSGVDYVGNPTYCNGQTLNLTSNGGSTVMNFGFRREYGSWWQAVGGDIYANYLESIIPASIAKSDRRLILADANGQQGLLTFGESKNIGAASESAVSNFGWEARSPYEGKVLGYDFYVTKTSMLPKTEWNGGKPSFAPATDKDYQIFTHTGDVALDNGSDEFAVLSGEKMIFLVDGAVTVGKNVTVADGGFLAVIASGGIQFSSSVTKAQGWFVGDTLAVLSNKSGNKDDVAFEGQGSFVGWSGISLVRDRGTTNNTAPSLKFIFRPDFKLNAPDAMSYSNFKWSEVAP